MRLSYIFLVLALIAPSFDVLAVYVPPPTRRFVWTNVQATPYSNGLSAYKRPGQLTAPTKDIIKTLTPLEASRFARITSIPVSKLQIDKRSLPEVVGFKPEADAYIQGIRRLRLAELTATYREAIERETIDKNIAELRQIVLAANAVKASGGLTVSRLNSILAQREEAQHIDLPPALTKIPDDSARKWSYKSGALTVKGKVGTFEYEQAFTVRGVAETGLALSVGAGIVACALDDNRKQSDCINDSLTFVHDIAIPSVTLNK